MTQSSLAAQAVMDAWVKNTLYAPIDNKPLALAAALRAVADQVVPITKTPWGSTLVPVLTAQESREKILAIATELEAL
jgi:hypothetical protein